MKKIFLMSLFVIEAVLLVITILQVVKEGTSMFRAVQSMLILTAFAKTEYDFIKLNQTDNKPSRLNED